MRYRGHSPRAAERGALEATKLLPRLDTVQQRHHTGSAMDQREHHRQQVHMHHEHHCAMVHAALSNPIRCKDHSAATRCSKGNRQRTNAVWSASVRERPHVERIDVVVYHYGESQDRLAAGLRNALRPRQTGCQNAQSPEWYRAHNARDNVDAADSLTTVSYSRRKARAMASHVYFD